MGPEAGFLLILIFIVFVIGLAVGFRLILGTWNHERIRKYIADKGGAVTEIQWSPFGPGWFATQDSVIYRVMYRDRDKNEHLAYCKTNIFFGVYLTEDKIIRMAQQQPQTGISLEEENWRLKEELRRLRAE